MRTPERGGTNGWGHQMLGTTVSSKYLKCNYENVLIKLMHTALCSHVALVLKCQPVCTSLVSSRTTRTKELANSPDSDGCCTLLQCIISLLGVVPHTIGLFIIYGISSTALAPLQFIYFTVELIASFFFLVLFSILGISFVLRSELTC